MSQYSHKKGAYSQNNKQFKRSVAEHAKLRFSTRYGIEYTDEVNVYIRSQIKHGFSKFLYALSRERTVHEVMVADIPVIVVWSKKHSIVVTVLPNRAYEKKLALNVETPT